MSTTSITLRSGSIREQVYNLFPNTEVQDEIKWVEQTAKTLQQPRNRVLAAFQYLVRTGLINRW